MTYFELLFISWACLGDSRLPLIGLSVQPIPESIRPAAAAIRIGSAAPVCQPRPEIERFTARAAVERRVKELGQGAAPRLRWCERFRCWNRSVEWKDRLVIDGREIR